MQWWSTDALFVKCVLETVWQEINHTTFVIIIWNIGSLQDLMELQYDNAKTSLIQDNTKTLHGLKKYAGVFYK